MLRRIVAGLIALTLLAGAQPAPAQAQGAAPAREEPAPPAGERKPQPRPQGTRVAVDPRKLEVDDGDTAVIHWSEGDAETIRILGIDTPETRHVPHDLPYAQAFGDEARGFAMGAFAAATKVELLRASMMDPYGRTLGYFYVNDLNYSVLVVRARLAEETVTRYGDNGLAKEAAEVSAAAKEAGPVPFESPGDYRRRMRAVSKWMKSKGIMPEE
jgi:endonuclease YncB( thermonuclease family)